VTETKPSLGRARTRRLRLLWWGLLAVLVGCAKSGAKPEAERGVQPNADQSYRYPAADRIVAIGDLHGDLAATLRVLQLAGALSADGHWSGGKLVVVQTGDQLDRGDDEPEILDLLERLQAEAKAAGGALHALNGNHEVMNVMGDFRYVTPDGFRDYADAASHDLHERALRQMPAQWRGRAGTFLSGEALAQRLSTRPAVIQVGDSVFVHGGLLMSHVRHGLSRINREIQEWMRSPVARMPPALATSEDGPLWSRAYSHGIPSTSSCQELTAVLASLSAKRLVVGHTVQEGGINSACAGRVWRIDVGLSRFYGTTPPSALEITANGVRVLRPSSDSPSCCNLQ
jgi:Calcineurin-like phosphoesterase